MVGKGEIIPCVKCMVKEIDQFVSFNVAQVAFMKEKGRNSRNGGSL